MKIAGTFSVAASREVAWRHLSDFPNLAPLLPGCESIVPVADDVYEVGARARVGPIKVSLGGTMHIVERREPETMQLRFEGRDAITTSHVRVAILFQLASTTADAIDVTYEADVLISGRLGTIGQGIMRETVATMLEEFVRRLNARIQGQPLDETSLARLSMKAAARSLRSGVAPFFRDKE